MLLFWANKMPLDYNLCMVSLFLHFYHNDHDASKEWWPIFYQSPYHTCSTILYFSAADNLQVCFVMGFVMKPTDQDKTIHLKAVDCKNLHLPSQNPPQRVKFCFLHCFCCIQEFCKKRSLWYNSFMSSCETIGWIWRKHDILIFMSHTINWMRRIATKT